MRRAFTLILKNHKEIFSRKGLSRFGFTLIEVLITILIIGILVTITLASYGSALANQRDTTRLTDMHTIANALGQFYLDHKAYPKNVTGSAVYYNTTYQLDKPTRDTNSCKGSGDSLVPNYLSAIPQDPQNKNTLSAAVGIGDCSVGSQNGQYLYSSITTGINSYILAAKMEKSSNMSASPPVEASIFSSFSENYYLQPKAGQ